MADTDSRAPVESTDEPVPVESGEHLASIVEGHDVVFVDFYADWCGPCQMMEPAVADLAATTEAVVAKVDVDRHQELAGRFGVQGVPTLVLFAGGEVEERQTGALPADQLRQLVERYTEA